LLFRVGVMPVADVDALPVRRDADADGTEIILLAAVREDLFSGDVLPRRPVPDDADAGHGALAEIGDEDGPAVLRGKRVLLVGEGAGGRTRAEVRHHPECPGPARMEV